MSNASLFTIADEAQWNKALDSYKKSVTFVQKRKKKDNKLQELDNWYQSELPKLLSARKYLKHSELVKLMTWKLTRGKFRPRLLELVNSNKPEQVESITGKGLEVMPDIERAIKMLSQLHGVGPATASAIVTAAYPESAAFMADESYNAVYPGCKITYTLPHYLDYLHQLKMKTTELNKAGTSKWSVHKVELALWSFHYACQEESQIKKRPLPSDSISSTKRQRLK